MSFRVEPLREDDVRAIFQLEKLSNPAPWSEESLRAEFKNGQAKYFGAWQGKELVGFAGYWAIVDEAHITNVAVHPEQRRKGIGRELVREILADAKSRKLKCATLEVRAGNVAAITLYEKFGFVHCGIRKRYYPNNHEDAVIMWLHSLNCKEL